MKPDFGCHEICSRLFQHVSVGVALISADGDIIRANAALCRLTGYTAEELQEHKILDDGQQAGSRTALIMEQMKLGDDSKPFECEGKLRLRSGHDVAVWQRFLLCGCQGHPRHLLVQFSTLPDEGGERLYLDIAERMPDAVVIGLSGKLVFVNHAAVKLFGAADKGELLGKDPAQFFSSVKHGVGGAVVIPDLTEYTLHRLDGKMIEVEVKSMETFFSGRPATYTLVRDISERKHTHEILKAAEKLNIVSQLAAGIAHEIRNPLTSVKGFLRLMKSGVGGKKEHLEIMEDEIDRIELIVGELLLLAKPQQKEHQRDHDIGLLLQHVAALLETQTNLNNVELSVETPKETYWVRCDENQMKQVIINLGKNAIEALPDGGWVRMDAVRRQSHIVIRVTDNGGGIPEETLHRLGEPFFTTKEKGTGLGLMISRKIIENHGGTLTVISSLGKGTTIEVALPYPL